jgi:hypothetical protein
MAYRLTETEDGRATALRAAGVMFPHDGLPDDAYGSVPEPAVAAAGTEAA